MPKISNLTGQKVFVTKEVRRPKEGKPDTKLSKLGKVHMEGDASSSGSFSMKNLVT